MAEQSDAERELSAQYPPGTRVSYLDSGAVVTGDVTVLASGTVNGPCIIADAIKQILDEDAKVVDTERVALGYVPVFTSRDNGREPTSIYVAVPNIVEAVKPGA